MYFLPIFKSGKVVCLSLLEAFLTRTLSDKVSIALWDLISSFSLVEVTYHEYDENAHAMHMLSCVESLSSGIIAILLFLRVAWRVGRGYCVPQESKVHS